MYQKPAVCWQIHWELLFLENHTLVELTEAAKYFFRSKDFDRAEYIFRMVLEREDHYEALFYLGLLSANRNDLDRAMKLFFKAVELNADYGNPCNEIGVILLRSGRDREAVYWLKKSLRCKVNDAPHISLYNLATLYKIWNRPERSLQYLYKAIEIRPDFQEARRLRDELASP